MAITVPASAIRAPWIADRPTAPQPITVTLLPGTGVPNAQGALAAFTSTGATTAAQLATAFANLAAGATTGAGTATGTYSGTLTGYTTGASASGVVTVSGATAADSVSNLPLSGATGIKALVSNGSLTGPETVTVTFQDMVAGETLTVGGLTYTSTGASTAAEVAAAFASMAAGAATGGGTSTGTYSGALSNFSSAAVSGTSVVFTSTTASGDVSNLAISHTLASVNIPVTTVSVSEGSSIVIQGEANDGVRLVGGWQAQGGSPVTINGIAHAVYASSYTPEPTLGNPTPTPVTLKVYVPTVITPGLLITSGEGAETQVGTAGDDEYRGNGGSDNFDAGAGNDLLDAGTGDDTVAGGSGNDTIAAGTGNDSVDAGTGNDSVDAGTGNDNVLAGEGDDTVLAGDGNDTVDGGTGNDSIDAGAGADSVLGGEGNDTLLGGAGDDSVLAGVGNDSVDAGGGNDVVWADAGNDTLDGGVGTDMLDFSAFTNASNGITISLATGVASSTDSGVDVLSNFENITGGAGADSITGGAGHDSVLGGAGADTITMSAADSSIDTIDAGSETDWLKLNGAAAGTVVVNLDAGAGNDQITTINGSAESVLQTNFENLDASAMTGAGIYATALGTGSHTVTVAIQDGTVLVRSDPTNALRDSGTPG